VIAAIHEVLHSVRAAKSLSSSTVIRARCITLCCLWVACRSKPDTHSKDAIDRIVRVAHWAGIQYEAVLRSIRSSPKGNLLRYLALGFWMSDQPGMTAVLAIDA